MRVLSLGLSVPKIRFCNNGDEIRSGRAQFAALLEEIVGSHCLALIKHREINDHPIEVVAQYFASLQRHCKSSVLKRSDYAISAGLAQPAIAASKISEFFEVTQHPTAEWLARQITILDLAAGGVDHEFGELGGVAGGLVMRPP